jgi:hypothetical protein
VTFSAGGDGGRKKSLSFSAANNGYKKKPRQRGRGEVGIRVTGVTVTIRTVTDTHFLHNNAISEIRWL